MVSDNLFLVCGLCSQVVDESMTIDDASLRSFLIHMLSITNDDLPAKVCTDCFQGTTECKKFADRCGRAISKLKNTRLSDHMILGKSARDKKQIKSMEAEVEASNPVQNLDVSDFDSKRSFPTPPPKKMGRPGPASRKGPRAPEVSTDLIIDSPSGRRATRGAVIPDEFPPAKKGARSSGAFQNGHLESPGPRSSRKSGGFEWDRYPVSKSQYRSLTARRNQPKAIIAQVERSLADQAYFSDTMSIDYRKRRQLATPVKTPARKGASPAARSRSAGPASRKRGGGMFDDADEDDDPLAVSVPKKSRRSLGSNEPPARSSFGRVRKMKKGYSEAVDPFEAADEEDPLDVTPPRQRSPPVSKPKSKPQSAKAKAATTGGKSKKEPDYYYVDGSGKRSKPVDDFADVGSDEEEIFPSIGPYQCEICQTITHTKQEFVDHIKNNHRKVVDEEVLRSLEHDLKISKKKEMKARLDVVRAAKEKKFERRQEAARLRAKERKRLNVIPPARINRGPKGKRGRPSMAAFARSAVPVAKKSVAPPPVPAGPKNMEVFSAPLAEERQPTAVAATNPKKSFARKYENQMSNEFLAADSATAHITSSPHYPVNPLETNEAEISAETDPFVSTEPMSSPPPVVTSTVSSSFDFIPPADSGQGDDDVELPPPHAAAQVQPDFSLENAAVVTSFGDQTTTATLTPMEVMPPPPPASYEMPEPSGADPTGMGMAMQTAGLQPYAVEQQPPQVLISGVETTLTPQDGLPFF